MSFRTWKSDQKDVFEKNESDKARRERHSKACPVKTQNQVPSSEDPICQNKLCLSSASKYLLFRYTLQKDRLALLGLS
jgi:hypothetical protein